MKLVYIFLTSALVLFGGKRVFASSDPGSELTMNQLRTALWQVGVTRVGNQRTSIKSIKKAKAVELPEELSKAIKLELNHLYNAK